MMTGTLTMATTTPGARRRVGWACRRNRTLRIAGLGDAIGAGGVLLRKLQVTCAGGMVAIPAVTRFRHGFARRHQSQPIAGGFWSWPVLCCDTDHARWADRESGGSSLRLRLRRAAISACLLAIAAMLSAGFG